MNDKQLKLYVTLIYFGVFVSVVLLLIDFKLKSDTIKMLGGNPNGGGSRSNHSHSNWNTVQFANPDLRPLPNERFAARVEEREDTGAIEETHPTDAELTELERRAYDSPVSEGD